MKNVTVVITTANRPQYLASALRSVAEQTAVGEIESVVVSENAGNRDSEKVCARFAGSLPIRYLFQQPQLTPSQHFRNVYASVTSDYAAVVHDDDWWFKGHLECSLSALRANPAASAAFSAALFVESELSLASEVYKPAPLVAAARPADHLSWWTLSSAQILAASWLCTPFHFSAMVLRRDAIRQAGEDVLRAHPNYADRIAEAGLPALGPVLFYPQPTVGVRLHSGNYRSDKTARHLHEADLEGTEKVSELARSQGIDLPGFWREILPGLSPEYRNSVANRFYLLFGGKGIRAMGLGPLLFPSRTFAAMKFCDRHLSGWVRPVLPPIVFTTYRRLRRKVSGS